MFFRSEHHRQVYMDMADKVQNRNIEYEAACYILSAIGKREMLSFMGNGIDFATMDEEIDLSSGERALLYIAANIFNPHYNHCDMSMLGRLDESNLLVVLEAIRMRYLP